MVVSGSWWFTVKQYLMGINESNKVLKQEGELEDLLFTLVFCMMDNVLHDTELFSPKEMKIIFTPIYGQECQWRDGSIMLPPSGKDVALIKKQNIALIFLYSKPFVVVVVFPA